MSNVCVQENDHYAQLNNVEIRGAPFIKEIPTLKKMMHFRRNVNYRESFLKIIRKSRILHYGTCT